MRKGLRLTATLLDWRMARAWLGSFWIDEPAMRGFL